MEICGSLGLPIFMVTRLNQNNGDMKRKLRAWRVQKCIALVSGYTVLTSARAQSTTFYGRKYRAHNEICGNSGLPILMVQRLHQSNGNIKRKILAWRVQKCITLVGADTVLTSAEPQSTPFHEV